MHQDTCVKYKIKNHVKIWTFSKANKFGFITRVCKPALLEKKIKISSIYIKRDEETKFKVVGIFHKINIVSPSHVL
jgi:hypothetical protein